MLLTTITIDGIDYYGSMRGFAGERFYHPWVKQLPSLELGAVEDSGKVGAKFGQITITNDFNNPAHPFYASRYAALLKEQRLYGIKIQFNETGTYLFDGNIYLQDASETDLIFTLTDFTYSLGARRFTLIEGFSFVEDISWAGGNSTVTLTANNHNLITGQFIIFEGMNNIGQTLNYVGPPTDNYYVVGSVPTNNTFTLLSKDFTPITSSSLVGTLGTYASDSETHRVGIAQRIPFSWGVITNATPVIKKRSDEIANPDLDISSIQYPIEIREDGVLIYSTSPTSTEYWNGGNGSGIAPTATTIKLNGNTTGGLLSISGVSNRGATLEQFFSYVAAQLGLTIDLTKTS